LPYGRLELGRIRSSALAKIKSFREGLTPPHALTNQSAGVLDNLTPFAARLLLTRIGCEKSSWLLPGIGSGVQRADDLALRKLPMFIAPPF